MKKKVQKKIFLKSLFFILFFLFFFSFKLVFASVIPNIWEGTGNSSGTCNYLPEGCNFCDGVIVFRNIINFLFQLAIPITVFMIVYGGLTILISGGGAFTGGSEALFKKGKEIVTNAVFGLIIILLSWSIVNIILHILVGQPNFPWNEIQCQ